MKRVRPLARPLVHFALGGAALFAAERAWRAAEPAGVDARPPVVISGARAAQIQEEHTRRYGAAATAAELDALLENEVDDELLYREALALGLDRDDASIRWRILQKMRFVDDAPGRSDEELVREGVALGLARDDIVIRRILAQKMRLVAQQPARNEVLDEAALAESLEAHEELYRQPSRISLSQVFLSRERRGDALEADAAALLAELRTSGAGAAEAGRRGDPFPLGHRLRAQSERQLARLFGQEFASAVDELPPGSWSGPVPSAYGLHLVFVEEKLPGRDPSLAEVRTQVEQRLRAERGEARVADLLRDLRERYEVRIEPIERADPSPLSTAPPESSTAPVDVSRDTPDPG
jgi:hypothetical protein